jgi:UDP-N-acetylglucosamine--N-acetylmuramyl-(pentapeptide) pyrophosphoryl-undecaprenol N-acetylglucosamine transferase
MVEENAAVLISNAELSGESLASAIRSMLSDTQKLAAIEKNARRIAVVDAEQRIVDLAERAAEKRGQGV